MTIHAIQEKLKAIDRRTLYGISFATGAALLAAVLVVALREPRHPAGPAEAAPVHAPVAAAELKPIDSVVAAAGSLASRNTSVLSSKVMGKVIYLGVQEGDHVAAGRLLMRIESGEIAAQLYQAKAAYTNAKVQYDRIRKLYDEKASTQTEMEQATLGLETAEAGLNAAKAMAGYTVITAPISGQIVEKRINLGEMAMPGQPVLKIEDNRNLRLEVTVNEQDILNIHPGSRAGVQIDAMPGKELTGTVAQVVPASDVRTHSFIVKVDIPSEKGLITGMYGKAFFRTGRREAIMAPRSAVVAMSGITGVYVLSGEGRALFQIVQLGEQQDGQVEVVSGLKAGDRVVADGTLGRIDGRKVIAAGN